MNNFEKDITSKINEAKFAAPLRTEAEVGYQTETDAYRGFINGEYDLSEFEDILASIPEHEGRIYFDTLPEFIIAVRKLPINKDVQDEILDHENAHALEAQQRGYSFRYALDYVRDEKRFLILKLVRTSIANAGVHIDSFRKLDSEPDDSKIREDIIAIVSAPEVVTNRKLGKSDKEMLNLG